jgi:hypothetical protein
MKKKNYTQRLSAGFFTTTLLKSQNSTVGKQEQSYRKQCCAARGVLSRNCKRPACRAEQIVSIGCLAAYMQEVRLRG